MREVHNPHAYVDLRWLGADEGGRPSPPAGPSYAATAVFDGVPDQPATSSQGEHFSFILQFENAEHNAAQTAIVEFLDIERVRPLLIVGQRLGVMEGSQRVAEAQVTHVPA